MFCKKSTTKFNCTNCDYFSSSTFNVQRHIRRMHKIKHPKFLKCQFCNEMYENIPEVRAHEKEIHGANEDTDNTKTIKFQISTHAQQNTSNALYSCDMCREKFVNKMDFDTHKEFLLCKEKPYRLRKENFPKNGETLPSKETENTEDMKITVKSEISIQHAVYSCDMCTEKFDNVTDFDIHKNFLLCNDGRYRLRNGKVSKNSELLLSKVKPPRTVEKLTTSTKIRVKKKGSSTKGKRKSLKSRKRTKIGMPKLLVEAYHCTLCRKSFVKFREFSIHVVQIHTTIRPYSCTICGRGFSAKKYWDTHVIICTKNKMKTSPLCDLSTPEYDKLETEVNCPLCNVFCSTSDDLFDHLREHKTDIQTSANTRDKVCNDISESQLLEPPCLESIHNVESPKINRTDAMQTSNTKNIKNVNDNKTKFQNRYKCKFCPKISLTSRTFRLHMKSHHRTNNTSKLNPTCVQQKKLFACKHCEFVSSSQHNLNRHEKLHTFNTIKLEPMLKQEKSDEIGEIQFEFNNNNDIKYVKEENDKELLKNRYECKFCVKILPTRALYRLHMKSDHQSVKLEPKSKEKQKQKLFPCKSCSFVSSYEQNLNRHEKIHKINNSTKSLDENIFSCKFCGFVSLYEHSLIRHERLHTETAEERRLSKKSKKTVLKKCHLCSFVTRHDLSRHMKGKHKVGKCHRCDVCGYQSFYRGTVVRHMIAIHHKRPDISCDKCNQKFASRHELKFHELQYISSNTSCDVPFILPEIDSKDFHDNLLLLNELMGESNIRLPPVLTSQVEQNEYSSPPGNDNISDAIVTAKEVMKMDLTSLQLDELMQMVIVENLKTECKWCLVKCVSETALLNHMKRHKEFIAIRNLAGNRL